MEKELYIVRHGETDYNRLGIVQGQGVDTSLNNTGWRQAEAFYNHYRPVEFELVITSRLRRTHETMQFFIEQGLPWEQYAEINEINWGKHEGKKSTPEMRAQYSQMLSEWQRGNFDARLEGAESAADMAARLRRFIEKLRKRPEKKILICSHGRAMRCLMCLLQDRPLQDMEKFRHSNTGLYLAHYREETFNFLKENDLKHLEHLDLKLA